ncbi:MAG TPA: hypothetical protein VFE58_08840 [Tepidisphaeraceae bacterium]|jgi:hypothetical protein|nr:hypothetical protein [Tepidisphaeraceae bacterium]
MLSPNPTHKTPLWLVIACWLIVAIPAAWGITQTLLRSLDLFTSH